MGHKGFQFQTKTTSHTLAILLLFHETDILALILLYRANAHWSFSDLWHAFRY